MADTSRAQDASGLMLRSLRMGRNLRMCTDLAQVRLAPLASGGKRRRLVARHARADVARLWLVRSRWPLWATGWLEALCCWYLRRNAHRRERTGLDAGGLQTQPAAAPPPETH